MRSALATLVFLPCIPLGIAAAALIGLTLGVGWLAIKIAPGKPFEDSFAMAPRGVR